MIQKVYIIIRFELDKCSEHIVKVYSDKESAKKGVDRLNKGMGDENTEYILKSFIVDGEESYD